MKLSVSQLALLSRLLDEALPLDADGRRTWLEQHSAEYGDLAEALRRALLPDDALSADSNIMALPKLGGAIESAGLAARDLQAGVRVGPYELIKPLGAGGMAQVWLARRADGAFKREVALKLPRLTHLRADLEQRFARERDILASLEHPQIARFYDAGVDPKGLPYLAIEYVQGAPLTDWCDTHRLGIAARLRLLLQVLEAVQYAHEKQVIHRDLKPSNVLVTETGQVRLLDFGVAKLLEAQEAEKMPLTGVYGRAVTPDYASPELLRGDPVDSRSDVYSLGVVLYELLTGVRPYRLKSAASLGLLERAIDTVEVRKPSTQIEPQAIAVRGTTPEKLAHQLRGDLDAIALKALAKQPTERYPTPAALAEDVRRYLEGRPIQARPGRLPDRLGKLVRRNKAMAGVSITAAAAILAAIGYSLYRESVYQVTVTAKAVAALPAAIPEKSIAVLPFVNMSSDREQDYFSDGLSEELIELLAKVPDIRVPARTSSFYFKGKQATISDIARALRVSHVLEGSVRKSGNELRITAQLIRADSGYHVWSETYTRQVSDIFKVQDDIAGAVVEALKVSLLNAKPLSNTHYSRSSEAYDQYLIGKQAYNRDDYAQAVSSYQRAVYLDSNFAAAYAGLAEAEADLADTQTGDRSVLKRAMEASERAIALAPDQPDAYAVRGELRSVFFWDWNGGRADIEKALSYNANSTWTLIRYGELLEGLGLLPNAIATLKTAVSLDPLSGVAWRKYGERLMHARRYSEAREALDRAHELSDSQWVPWFQGQLEVLDGHSDKALTLVPSLNKGFSYNIIALAAHSLGRESEAQAALSNMIVRQSEYAAYQIAEIYSWRNETGKAFEWLNRCYAQHDSGLRYIKVDPFLDSLRSDARYGLLLSKLNLTP